MTFSEKFRPRGNLILGYTTRRHLILDLDNSTLEKTTRIARMIMREWPKVGDCLILRSSEGSGCLRIRYSRMGRPLVTYRRDNYHLVFDNGIGYNASCRICETLAGIGILNKDYVRIREFRGDMTLRVGPSILIAGNKPIPEPVGAIITRRSDKKDWWILHYLRCLDIARSLFSPDHYPEDEADQREDRPDHSREEPPVKAVLDRPDFQDRDTE